jgi:hypothetical protein
VSATYTVHVAGLPVDMVQRCVPCGAVLCDNRGWAEGRVAVHPAPPDDEPQGPPFWEVASRVAKAGGASYWIETSRVDLTDDEEPCR